MDNWNCCTENAVDARKYNSVGLKAINTGISPYKTHNKHLYFICCVTIICLINRNVRIFFFFFNQNISDENTAEIFISTIDKFNNVVHIVDILSKKLYEAFTKVDN